MPCRAPAKIVRIEKRYARRNESCKPLGQPVRTGANRCAASQIMAASGVNLLAGIWLIIAPFLLGYSDQATPLWNDIIVGILIVAFAGARVAGARVVGAFRAPSLSWVNVILGGWLIVAPFLLGYSDDANPLWNDIIVGIIVVLFGIWSAVSSPRTTAV